jgi:threonine dehydratase
VIDTQLVTLRDLEAAARVLAPVAVRTPLLPADAITDQVGGPVWIKP